MQSMISHGFAGTLARLLNFEDRDDVRFDSMNELLSRHGYWLTPSETFAGFEVHEQAHGCIRCPQCNSGCSICKKCRCHSHSFIQA
jgi:hypothetical protein